MQVRRGGQASWLPALALCVAFAMPAVAAAADSMPLQILVHEPFRPIPAAPVAGASKSSPGSIRQLKFDAYGRRFNLLLEPNRRLTGALPTSAEGPALTLYQGTLENVPNSWVRMSAKAQAIRGAIWDGRELYLVDSSAALGPSVAAETEETIIFRLSDTQVPAGSTFCGDAPKADAQSGQSAYSNMLRELKNSPVIMQAAGATSRLEISALADALFRTRYGTDSQAQDAILSRINIVDGIYSSQLNVEIQIPTMNLNDAVAAQLSATTDANELIKDLGQLRKRTPVLHARGLTHLFTGRDLQGTTVGIAYTAGLCRDEFGAGLTQTGSSTTIDALITAHEIGHNFGAPHDGEKACTATPAGQYLMSPSVNTNATTFSQCSLNQIRPHMQSASCLLPLTAPDLAIPLDLGTTQHAVAKPFSWELQINNIGGSTANSSDVTLWVPPVMLVQEAFVAGGTCTSGAGRVQCQMGNIPASGSRVVKMTLQSDVIGSNSIAARVFSGGDLNAGNNSGDGTLVIDPEADLSVSTAAPASVLTGSTLIAGFIATNAAAIAVESVEIAITAYGGVSLANAEIAGGSCLIASASTAQCSLPSLAAGTSASGTLTLNALTSGNAAVRAQISGGSFDPAAANNAAEQAISVVATATATPASRSKGGGGSGDLFLLAALSSLRGLRRLRCTQV